MKETTQPDRPVLRSVIQSYIHELDPRTRSGTARPVFSAFRVLSGFATLDAAISGITAIKESSAIAAFRKYRQKKPVEQTRQETFDEAVQRFGLTEEDLKARFQNFRDRAANWFLAFALALVAIAYTPLSDFPITHFVTALGAAIFAASRTLRWHFRACQVRDRELYDFRPWLHRDQWVKRVTTFVLSLIGLVLLLTSVKVYAQATQNLNWTMFSPTPGDPTVNLLRLVFGPVVDLIHDGSDIRSGDVHGTLGHMLVPFNGAVLFLGALFIAYTTIRGTIDSAHDGEILGRKLSTTWVPLRTLAGTAVLLPVASGYSLVQVAILWLALQAVGIANTIVSAAADEITETNMVSFPNIPNARPLALQVLAAETCAAAMNAHWQETGRKARIELRETTRDIRSASAGELSKSDALLFPVVSAIRYAQQYIVSGYTVTDFDWSEVSGGNYVNGTAICGSLRWQESQESADGNGNDKIAKGPIMAAHAAAVRELIRDVRPIAAAIVAGQKPTPTALDSAIHKYERRLVEAAKAAVDQTNDKGRADFLQFLREGGWIYLPTYYNQLIRLQDNIQAALNTLPTATGSRIEELEMPEEVQKLKDAKIVLQELVAARVDRSDAAQRAYQAYWDNEVPTIPKNWEEFKRWISAPAIGSLNRMTHELAGANLSHIGQIKAVGDTITTAGWTIVGGMMVASGLANSNASKFTIGNVFDIGAALGVMSSFVTSIALILLFFGVWAAFYIPAIPYLMGITAIIKWFVLVFESVIAAPIFAVAHIHPDGDDAVGRAGPGYMMILGNLMRPTLIVFGFFGSIWLAQPIAALINATFMTMVVGAQGDSVSGLGAFITYSGIYCMLMTGVIHSIFTLVNWLPDNVLRWIGGALGAHGVADAAAESTERSFRAAVAAVKFGSVRPPAPAAAQRGNKQASHNRDATQRELLQRPF